MRQCQQQPKQSYCTCMWWLCRWCIKSQGETNKTNINTISQSMTFEGTWNHNGREKDEKIRIERFIDIWSYLTYFCYGFVLSICTRDKTAISVGDYYFINYWPTERGCRVRVFVIWMFNSNRNNARNRFLIKSMFILTKSGSNVISNILLCVFAIAYDQWSYTFKMLLI